MEHSKNGIKTGLVQKLLILKRPLKRPKLFQIRSKAVLAKVLTMSSTERMSLHSFSKAIGASKTTVHRKAKELGIDTSNGLTESDRSRLIEVLKPTTDQGSIVPSGVSIVPSGNSRLGSVIDSYSLPQLDVLPTYKHTPTADFVANELAKLNGFVEGSTAQTELLTHELIQQALARGAKTGTILAQVEIAAIENQRKSALQNYGKKQGLEAS